MKKKHKKAIFRIIAEKASAVTGSAKFFCIAILGILVWGISGFFFDFDNTWQLIINTGTTILTLLLVILIQNTQNRESRSIQIKLDELVYHNKSSRNSLVEIEEQSDEEIEEFKKEFQKLREKYISRRRK